jgi:hypothetical protein
VFDAEDRAAQSLVIDPGADGRIGTADDAIEQATLALYDAAAPDLSSDVITFDGPGPDGVWGTGDDHSSASTHAIRDSRGLILSQRSSTSGPDGTADTADDKIVSVSRFTYDPAGEVTSSLVSDAPGPDGVWGNDDDHLANYTDASFADGARILQHTFTAGPDGIAHNRDDQLSRALSYDTSR